MSKTGLHDKKILKLLPEAASSSIMSSHKGYVKAVNVFHVQVIKARGRMEVKFHSFLTSTLDGCEWLALRGWQFRWYTLKRRPNEPHNRSARFGEEINLLALPGIETKFLGCQNRSLPVFVITTLSRRLFFLIYQITTKYNSYISVRKLDYISILTKVFMLFCTIL